MARVKYLQKKTGEKINISRFPNFHKSGSIKGMKLNFYGKDALLVQSGSYIYNVTSAPEIYNRAK